MSKSVSKLIRGLAGGIGLSLAVAAGAIGLAAGIATRPAQAAGLSSLVASEVKVGDKIKITLKDGTVVEGEVVEVTATGWRVRVAMGIGTSVRTVEKADLKSIEMADGSPAEGGATSPTGRPTLGPGGGSSGARTGAEPKKPGETVVHFTRLRGVLGQDLSPTPLRRILKDARETQADVIVFMLDMEYTLRGQTASAYDAAGGAKGAYDQLGTVRELETLLTDDIQNNPAWVTKPRVVMWVKKGMGGPAFLALPIRDVFFHPEGHLGGIGYLDQYAAGVGDEVAQEKQRGLRLGRALGLALKGGHDPKIVTAMSRADYPLAYRLVGGKPVFYETKDPPADAFILTNGGSPPDTAEDILNFRGKNVLTLDAQTALNLNFSRGTVSTIEQLLAELGVERNFRIIRDTGEKEFKRWRELVNRAETDIRNLWARFQNTEVNGETPARRNGQRDQRIGALNRIKSILAEYGEAISPRALPVGGSPVDCARELDVMIEQLQIEKRNDRPAGGGGGGGGGGGPQPNG